MRRHDAFVAVAALAVGGVFAPSTASAGVAGSLGDIPLVDQSGATFRLRELAGRPAVITFIATRCRDTCPIANAVFSELASRGSRARLITVSLDPEYDTPFVMSKYARELDAHAPAWDVVTGKPRDVVRLLQAFGVVRERGSDGIFDAHSSFVYILNKNGVLTRTLPLSTNTVADVRATLSRTAL